MKTNTSIEVKCDCRIPFHSELVAYLEDLSGQDSPDHPGPTDLPHKEIIRQALISKMLFIKVHFARPMKRWRPKLLKSVQHMLNKDLVGTIRVGADEVTLIML
jgi:hypothetical protein